MTTTNSPSDCDSEALRLALLGDLESSLRASGQAILSRDVAKLERVTEEQAVLNRRLLLLPPEVGRVSPAATSAHRRVLALVRIQSALLQRAVYRLRVLANWIAGTRAEYRPVSGNSAVVASVSVEED